MTDKITLTSLVNLQNETTAVNAINTNNAVITAAFDNTLSLDGTNPNSMTANLDMNSNHILNLPAPTSANEPVRYTDIQDLTAGGSITFNSIPTGGSTGQALAKNSSSNYDATWQTFYGIPSGGTSGQVLNKNSNTSYDVSWITLPFSGGSVGTGTTSVTGTSTVYTSSQNGVIVLRSNSGSYMADTLPGSPDILPQGTTIKVINDDVAGMLAIQAGAGTTFVANTPDTGWLYIAPKQSATFYSDGATYWTLDQPSMNVLQSNTTLYCSPSGVSTHHGLDSSVPVESITHAYNLAKTLFVANGYTITIKSADGAYTTPQIISGRIAGQSETNSQRSRFPVVIQGNTTTPTNCTITATSDSFGAVQVLGNASVLIEGFELSTVSGGNCIYVNFAWCAYKTITFSSAAVNHICATHQAHVEMAGAYTIIGSAESHWLTSDCSSIFAESTATVTLTGTPNFSTAFVATQYPGSVVLDFIPTFSGSATGARYAVGNFAVINTGGQGANYFPGNSAGGGNGLYI